MSYNAHGRRTVRSGASAGAALILFLLLAAIPGLAQAQSGFSRGWYVGPVVHLSQIDGEFALLSGFRIEWSPRDRVVLSAESNRLLSEHETAETSANGTNHLFFFYSGIAAEYGIPVGDRLTVAPRLLVGGAEAHWRGDFMDAVLNDFDRDPEHTTSLVLEPGIAGYVTLLPWPHATVGGNYRIVAAGKSNLLSQAEMRGLAGSVGVRFGRL